MFESQTHIQDVAEFILQSLGPLSAMKLQKLVYYCQAWSLVWDDRPLFPESIEAWANGPVAPDLFAKHRGQFLVRSGDLDGRPEHIDKIGQETIEAVLNYYGSWNAQQLSDLTHAEAPWIITREGLEPGSPSDRPISWDVMAEYYANLPPDEESST